MARQGLFALAAALTLAACQMTLPFGGDRAAPPATALPGGAIEVTPLDAATPDTAAPDTAAPESAGPAAAEIFPLAQEEGAPAADPPVSDTAEAVPPAESTPAPPPKSEAQTRCERQGGTWTADSNTSLKTCVKPTRDGGKQCSRKTDCKGECLARSGTCAPFSPLLGCNDVLLADGTRTTQCIE